MGGMMQDLAFAIPGIDEAMSFSELMKSVLSSRDVEQRADVALEDMSSR